MTAGGLPRRHAGSAFPHAGPASLRSSRLPGTPAGNARNRAQRTKGSTVLHILWMFIVGIVVGAIARFIMPGADHIGLLMTGVLGIAGSFVGGFIARLFSKPPEGAPVHPAGIVMSVIGAMILLYAWHHLAR